jgi:hypothetical protein
MTSLALGPTKSKPDAALKQDANQKDEAMELVAFETEVLYERIEELECEVKKYQHLLQRIKYAVDSDENVKEKVVHILNPPKLKTYKVTTID